MKNAVIGQKATIVRDWLDSINCNYISYKLYSYDIQRFVNNKNFRVVIGVKFSELQNKGFEKKGSFNLNYTSKLPLYLVLFNDVVNEFNHIVVEICSYTFLYPSLLPNNDDCLYYFEFYYRNCRLIYSSIDFSLNVDSYSRPFEAFTKTTVSAI